MLLSCLKMVDAEELPVLPWSQMSLESMALRRLTGSASLRAAATGTVESSHRLLSVGLD